LEEETTAGLAGALLLLHADRLLSSITPSGLGGRARQTRLRSAPDTCALPLLGWFPVGAAKLNPISSSHLIKGQK